MKSYLRLENRDIETLEFWRIPPGSVLTPYVLNNFGFLGWVRVLKTKAASAKPQGSFIIECSVFKVKIVNE